MLSGIAGTTSVGALEIDALHEVHLVQTVYQPLMVWPCSMLCLMHGGTSLVYYVVKFLPEKLLQALQVKPCAVVNPSQKACNAAEYDDQGQNKNIFQG